MKNNRFFYLKTFSFCWWNFQSIWIRVFSLWNPQSRSTGSLGTEGRRYEEQIKNIRKIKIKKVLLDTKNTRKNKIGHKTKRRNCNSRHSNKEELQQRHHIGRFAEKKTNGRLNYSRLSLSRSPRGSLKYFEISLPRHIRFAKFRGNNIIEQPHLQMNM